MSIYQDELLTRRALRTINILNGYRVVGTVLLWIVTGVGTLVTVIEIATKGSNGGWFFLATFVLAITAVLFYAIVGWLADTLGLLMRLTERVA